MRALDAAAVFRIKRCVVVVANPDDADEVRGVAGKPCVVIGAGFACRGSSEAHVADSSAGSLAL